MVLDGKFIFVENKTSDEFDVCEWIRSIKQSRTKDKVSCTASS